MACIQGAALGLLLGFVRDGPLSLAILDRHLVAGLRGVAKVLALVADHVAAVGLVHILVIDGCDLAAVPASIVSAGGLAVDCRRRLQWLRLLGLLRAAGDLDVRALPFPCLALFDELLGQFPGLLIACFLGRDFRCAFLHDPVKARIRKFDPDSVQKSWKICP